MKTISFKLAKELKELGVKKDAFFQQGDNDAQECEPIYWAYTLDEILDMLPDKILYNLPDSQIEDEGCDQMTCKLRLLKQSNNYAFYYSGNYRHWSKNPAESAGKLLIWCIENGHTKVEDLNNENEHTN